MSSANVDTAGDVPELAGMDNGTASSGGVGIIEEVQQYLDTSTTVESADQLSVGTDLVSEPEFTNVSSETSNSSQGVLRFHS